MRSTPRALALAAGFAALALGCGGPTGPPRFGLSGTVTLKGKPLDQGQIMFLGEGDTRDRGGATIIDGKYDVPAAQGLTAGKYKVVLSSGDPSKQTTAEFDTPPVPKGQGEDPAKKKDDEKAAPPAKEDEGPTKVTDIVSEERIPAEFNKDSKLTVEVGPGKPATFDVKIP